MGGTAARVYPKDDGNEEEQEEAGERAAGGRNNSRARPARRQERVSEDSGQLTMDGVESVGSCIRGQMTMLAAAGADEVSSVCALLSLPLHFLRQVRAAACFARSFFYELSLLSSLRGPAPAAFGFLARPARAPAIFLFDRKRLTPLRLGDPEVIVAVMPRLHYAR